MPYCHTLLGLDARGCRLDIPHALSVGSRALLLIANATFRLFWHERLGRVISDALNNPKTFRSPLSEKETVAGRQVFGPLHELEGDRSPVSSPDKGAVNIDDGAGLGNRPDV